MYKSNIHKKVTYEDKFARKFYCQHARLNSIRSDKRHNTKQMRAINKKVCRNEIDE